MRIGEMASNMMMLARYQNQNQNRYQTAQTEIATGKRVNSAADDPSAIGRIERTKALINETRITQSALDRTAHRNQAMESTLNEMGNMSTELHSLSVEYNGVAPDKDSLEQHASSLLNAMADMQSSTQYNGSNPFTDNANSIRLTGGNPLSLNPPKFQITKNASDPTHYDITLNDGTTLTDQSVQDILDSDFVQDNLSNQISGAKATIGINDRVLKSRINIESKNEEILTKTLSRIEDADLAKSTIDANIASQMMSLNQGLMYTASGQMQNQVGSLFNLLA